MKTVMLINPGIREQGILIKKKNKINPESFLVRDTEFRTYTK